MPPRRPGTREELKERVLAKYGATNITDDYLAALMALQPELDILFSQVRSFTNMSDGLRLTLPCASALNAPLSLSARPGY